MNADKIHLVNKILNHKIQNRLKSKNLSVCTGLKKCNLCKDCIYFYHKH